MSQPDPSSIPEPSFRTLRLSPGQKLAERYFLERLLGHGNKCETWKAFDPDEQQTVVLKLFPKDLRELPAFEKGLNDLFQRVFQLDTPQHLPPFRLEEDDQSGPILVSPFVEGTTLDDYHDQWLRNFHSFSRANIVRILVPLAKTLDAAHAQRIVHKSLKPQNILIDKNAGVRIVDFEIPNFVRSMLQKSGLVELDLVDAVPYTAPEVLRGEPHSPRSDQFSLACVAYELISNERPFRPEENQTVQEAVANAAFRPISGQSYLVNNALERALAADPRDRFFQCGELVDTLMDALLYKELLDVKKKQQKFFSSRWGFLPLLFGVSKPDYRQAFLEEITEPIWPFNDHPTPFPASTGSKTALDLKPAKPALKSASDGLVGSSPPAGSSLSALPGSGVASATGSSTLLPIVLWGTLGAVALIGGIGVGKTVLFPSQTSIPESLSPPPAASSERNADRNVATKPTDRSPGSLPDAASPETVSRTERPTLSPENGTGDSSQSTQAKASKTSPNVPPSLSPQPTVSEEPLSQREAAALEKLAESGDVPSQLRLALLLQEESGGVAQNEEKAVQWLRVAATKLDPEAMYQLGLCYENGRGVEPDEKRAFAWYEKAADAKHTEAAYRLGQFYELGRGLPASDRGEAVRNYQKAADAGHPKAAQALERLK